MYCSSIYCNTKLIMLTNHLESYNVDHGSLDYIDSCSLLLYEYKYLHSYTGLSSNDLNYTKYKDNESHVEIPFI